jgi:predicted deacylase
MERYVYMAMAAVLLTGYGFKEIKRRHLQWRSGVLMTIRCMADGIAYSWRFLLLCLVLLWPAAGVGALPGDGQRVSSGLIARGLPSETPYFIRQAAEPGPTVLVIGGMHGNEPAGAEAAEHIRHWPITRGRLVVVPRANPPALEKNVRHIPGKPRSTGNLNRNFPATRSERDVRGPTAEHLWEFITILKPEWILDLHEGYDFHARNKDSVGSSVIHFDDEATTPIALKMRDAVNAEVDDEDKRFLSLSRSGPVDTGMVRATIHYLGARGMVLETTWKDQPMSLRARQHRTMVHTLLRELGMVDGPLHVMVPARNARERGKASLHVALYDDAGTGGNGVSDITRIVGEMPGAVLRYVGGADIRDGVLDQFDVIVFPGGGGGTQGRNLGELGRERVRAFIQGGGGYVGICAGAYLATCRLDSYLHMVRSYHYNPWRTGRGPVVIELTGAGREVLGGDGSVFEVRYANGPLLFHEDGTVPDLDLPEFEALATFIRGVEKEGERQTVMEGTPAIVCAPFGSGRVMLISPHPESSEELSWLVERALEWAAGQETARPSRDHQEHPSSAPAGELVGVEATGGTTE